MQKSEQRLIYERRIHRVQDYINTHFDEKLDLKKLARISAFSPYHFHRIFKSIAGETLYDFIQRIRLEKACAMLSSDHNMRIIDIALSCGFSTPSSFSKAFKQRYDISPSDYRAGNYDKKSNKQSNLETRKSKNGTGDSNTGKESNSPVVYISDTDLEYLYLRREKMNNFPDTASIAPRSHESSGADLHVRA